MTDELDPQNLAAARKSGRLLRRRTIRNRVVAGMSALFLAIAVMFGYRDLSNPPLTGSASNAASVSVPALGDGGYPVEADDEEYEDEEEGEDEDEEGDDEVALSPVLTPTPAPVVTQQS